MIDVTRATTALDLVRFLDEHARRQGLNLDQVDIIGLWLNANPTGLAEVAAVTRAMSAHNGRAPTIAQVWDELRTRRITDGPEHHWDNTLRAPVARGVMRRYPDLAGTFPTRRSKVDR